MLELQIGHARTLVRLPTRSVNKKQNMFVRVPTHSVNKEQNMFLDKKLNAADSHMICLHFGEFGPCCDS